MKKREFELNETEVNELKGVYQQCQDSLTKTRYQAVRLYGTGYMVSEIEEISGCSRPSLMEWCRRYRQYGPAGLVDQNRDAPFTINHVNGSTTVRVDQRTNGAQWNLLGTFYFQGNGAISLSDDFTSGRDVVADSVRIVFRGQGLPSDINRVSVGGESPIRLQLDPFHQQRWQRLSPRCQLQQQP